jgi:hypothetical protein
LRALKCDNCGEFYDYSVLAITKIAWSRPDGSKFREKDICPECLAAVSKALEDVKMRKNNNPLEDDLK